MNLQDGNDFTGFPARDRIPSKILTDFPKTMNEYSLACYAFFTALFVVLEEHLSALLASDNGKADIKHWAEQMCSVSYPPRFTAREEFFTKVAKRYLKVLINFVLVSLCLTSLLASCPDDPSMRVSIFVGKGFAD